MTAQNVGTNANINVFDHKGEPGISTQTASIRAGMIAGGNVILIGVEGEVLSLSIASGEVTTLDSLSDPALSASLDPLLDPALDAAPALRRQDSPDSLGSETAGSPTDQLECHHNDKGEHFAKV